MQLNKIKLKGSNYTSAYVWPGSKITNFKEYICNREFNLIKVVSIREVQI